MALGYFRLNNNPPLIPNGVFRYRFKSVSAGYDEYLEWQVDNAGVATQHGSAGSFNLTSVMPTWFQSQDLALQPPVANDYVLTMYNNSPLGGAIGTFNACQIPDQCNAIEQCGSFGVKLTDELGALPTTTRAFFGNIISPQNSYSISGLRIFNRPTYNTDPCGNPNQSLSVLGLGNFTTFEAQYAGANEICGPYQTAYGYGTETTVPLGYIFYRQLENLTDSSLVDNNGVLGGYIAPQISLTCPQPCVPPTIVAGSNMSNGVSGSIYLHEVILSGDTPFTLSNIVKPSWATVTVSGIIVTITGTASVGNNIPVSFNITNACGTISFSDTFNVPVPCDTPVVQSITETTCVNSFPYTISSSATSGLPLTYQWSRDIANTGAIAISSATGTSYIINTVDDLGIYYFVATNSCESTTVSKRFTTKPIILTQPVGVTNCLGTHNLSVVTKAIPMTSETYQWKRNSVVISGAVSNTYTATQAGTYTVEIDNICGTTISNNAVVVFNTPVSQNGIFNLADSTVASAYNQIVSYSGTLPFTLSNIVKPSWLSITVSSALVTLSGTPSISDIAQNIPISWTISNVCNNIGFSDTINVLTNCTPISGGNIFGNTNVVNGGDETYTISGLTGSLPMTFNWFVNNGTIVSGQETSTIVVRFNGVGNNSISCLVLNCVLYGVNKLTLNKVINVGDSTTVANSYVAYKNNTFNDNVSTNDIPCTVGVTSYELVSLPTNGTLSLFNTTNGLFSYVPNNNYLGTDSFTYRIKCNNVAQDTPVNVNINVIGATALLSSLSLNANSSIQFNLALNDIACNDSTVTTYHIDTNVTHGVVTNFNSSNGTGTYTPNANYVGNDDIAYSIKCNNITVSSSHHGFKVLCVPITTASIQGKHNPFIDSTEKYTAINFNGTGPYIYQWNVIGGTIINGQGTVEVNVKWTTSGSIGLIIKNCNDKNVVNNIMSVNITNCIKSVSLAFCCGNQPYYVTIANECSPDITLQSEVVFNSTTGIYTYSVPNDGFPHTYIITIKDKNGNIVSQFKRINVKC